MKLGLFLLSILSIILLSAASTVPCNLIGLNYDTSLQVTQNTQSAFGITFSNNGVAQESLTVNAQCPSAVTCSFDKSAFQLQSGQSETTNFNVKSNQLGSFQIPLQVTTSFQTCTATIELNVTKQLANNTPITPGSAPLSVKFTGVSPVNARPGDSVKYEFELKNNLNKKIFVELENGVNPFKDSTFFEFNDVALEAGETKTVNVRIVTPPGSPGGQFMATLIIDAQDCCSQKLEFPVEIDIHGPKINLNLQTGPSPNTCIELNRGDTAVLNFSIKNSEEIEGPFKIVVTNKEPKLLITTKTSTFSLETGSEIQSAIIIKASNTTTLDTYKYTVEGKFNQFTFLEREYCVDVVGSSNVQITNVDKSKLTRASLETIHFTVTNTGNVEDEFAFTLPIYARFTSLEIDQPVVKLTPGQSKQIALTIGTDIFTPLGDFKLPIRVDSKTYGQSKVFNLNFTFYSSSTPGSSLIDLVLQSSELRAVPGQTKHIVFFASNFADEKLRNAQILVSGIPSDWTSSEVIDLEAGESKEIIVSFTVPKSETRKSIPIQLTLSAKTASGQDETVTRDAILLTPSSDLSFIVRSTTENHNFNGEVTGIVLDLVVTNNGQQTLSDLTPALLADEDNYLLSFKSDQEVLTPGQSAQVQVVITPKTSTSQANVELQFESSQIEGQSKTILLPAMTIITGSGTILKIIAVFFLLIGISYLLVKEQNQI